MKLSISVTPEKYYETYFRIMNGVLALSNKEILILSEFCSRYYKLVNAVATEEVNKIVFGAESRKLVASAVNMSIYNLNNYMHTLRTKKLIIKDDNGYSISPRIYVPLQDIEILFNLSVNESSTN